MRGAGGGGACSVIHFEGPQGGSRQGTPGKGPDRKKSIVTDSLRTALARLRQYTPAAGGSLPNTPNPPATPEHKHHGLENRGSPGRGSSFGGGGNLRGAGSDTGGSQSPPQPTLRGHFGPEAPRNGDLLSSALKRLNFRSTGGSRSCRSTVPAVVVRESSTASETTINTSTDSANTMVTMVTTTDGEQPDSFDLVDVAPEFSPPPTGGSSKPNSLRQPNATQFTGQNLNSNLDDGPAIVPPPTPLLGAHQESRFTFTTSTRTPPTLPDLRATEFFSTPVRGSVDAGQPDGNHISSMLSLVASKERSNSLRTGSLSNHVSKSSQQQAAEKLADHNHKKPNINVTTNPLDISLIGSQSPCNTQTSVSTRSRGRPAGGSGAGTKRPVQATIVVQQPSLSDAPATTILLHPDARRREENMITLQQIRDFEKRHGQISPHHSRSQSVKTPGSRSSGRPNLLSLPQQRARVASMPNTGVEEEYYRLRHFSITVKGVENRGDSIKSRRSRSNNSVASSNSSTEHLAASYPGSARNSAAGSLASSRESSASQGPIAYRVLMLGAPAVGKTTLVNQFMTSEHLLVHDKSIDDESEEKSVSVLLNGEESELIFIDRPFAEMSPENCIATYEPHAYCVVYSTTDKSSLHLAEEVLQSLWRSNHVSSKAVILVGNKVDLARSRDVSTEDGQSMATSYDCKFVETSVSINHNVDHLLVGLLTQIRLKLENPEKARDVFRKKSRKNRSRSPMGANSPKKSRCSRKSASLKVRNLLDKVWARDSKSKSCENLHVL